MNGTKAQNVKWGKSDRERQVLYDITYMWNPKKPNSYKQRVKWGLPKAGERGDKINVLTFGVQTYGEW